MFVAKLPVRLGPYLMGIASVVLWGGCSSSQGPQRASLKGSVTFEEQPVEQGTIIFFPSDAKLGQAVGGNIVDGKYEIPRDKGPFPGSYTVQITASRKTGRQVQAAPPAPPGMMIDETKPFLPAKYNTKSELKAEIAPGANTRDFALTP